MEIKKKYIKPRIELVPLDKEISLALESYPPLGPDETSVINTDSYRDPHSGVFKFCFVSSISQL